MSKTNNNKEHFVSYILDHWDDLFYLFWAIVIVMFYKTDSASLGNAIFGMTVLIVFYQFSTNVKNKRNHNNSIE